MRKVWLVGILILVVAGIVLAGTNSGMLVDWEQLKIDPSICEKCNKTKTFYVYENGWVEKRQPMFWWMCTELEGKVHYPDAKASYGTVAGLSIGAKKLENGGVFIDPYRGVLFVYVRNDEGGKKVLDMVNGTCKVVLLKGKYPIDQLERWKRLLGDVLGCCANNSIGVTAVGADDTMNRVFIGLKKVNQEKLKELEKVLKEHNIPLDAVMVEEMVIKVDLLRTDYRL